MVYIFYISLYFFVIIYVSTQVFFEFFLSHLDFHQSFVRIVCAFVVCPLFILFSSIFQLWGFVCIILSVCVCLCVSHSLLLRFDVRSASFYYFLIHFCIHPIVLLSSSRILFLKSVQPNVRSLRWTPLLPYSYRFIMILFNYDINCRSVLRHTTDSRNNFILSSMLLLCSGLYLPSIVFIEFFVFILSDMRSLFLFSYGCFLTHSFSRLATLLDLISLALALTICSCKQTQETPTDCVWECIYSHIAKSFTFYLKARHLKHPQKQYSFDLFIGITVRQTLSVYLVVFVDRSIWCDIKFITATNTISNKMHRTKHGNEANAIHSMHCGSKALFDILVVCVLVILTLCRVGDRHSVRTNKWKSIN